MQRPLVLALVAVLGATAAADDDHGTPHAPLSDVTALDFTAATGFAATLPELTSARTVVRSTARAATQLPLLWTPFAVRVMPQLAFGTPEGSGVRLNVEQAIPLSSRREAARSALQAESAQYAAEAAALDLEARLEIARAWIDSWLAGATLAEAQRARDLARQIVAVTERAVGAGAATTPELADVRALLASAETQVLDAEGRARDATFRLGAAVGADGPRRATGELPSVMLPAENEEAQLAAVAAAPVVRARRLAALAAQARGREIRAGRAHQVLVGGELTLDPGGDRRVAATLGFAWSAFDRGEREVAAQRAEAVRLEGEASGIARRARFELAQALHDVEHSGELLAEIDSELVPAVDDAAARRRRAYELGESTVIEVLSAERTALAGHQTAIAARADHVWARVRARVLLEAGGVK